MTTEGVEQALLDPIGVIVGLITAAEPALDAEVVEDVVTGIAGGRAKRRRLALALTARPAVLRDGRSPAPRAIGDLLIALRRAGSQAVSPPCCADCGKHLRSLQRRGEHWYCTVCATRPQRCSVCGQERIIASRDRQGRPRCDRCPDRDDRDPLSVLAQVITRLDPSLATNTVTAAARRVFSRPAGLRRLAWAIEDQPGLLTGAGAQAPLSGVLRLIDELCQAGARHITRPECPRCHRVVRLHRRLGGRWICRNCLAKARAVPCARCGVPAEPAARDGRGRPLCPTCLVTDPINLENCVDCGRRRKVSVRTRHGPLCETCRPWKTMDCAICGRTTPCVISAATGQPWCGACQQRWARCCGCGQLRNIRGGTLGAPLCAECLRTDPSQWRPCLTCGQIERLRSGSCTRCVLDQRLRELLDDGTGQIRPELRPLHQTLAATPRPATVLRWLGGSTAPIIVRELGTGQRPLTHHALDELPDSKPVEHLRSVLVATGVLPPRDEQMIRLERRVNQTIAEQADPAHQQLLHRYGVWHLLRRLRRRNSGAPCTYNQAATVRRQLRGAVVFLHRLTSQQLTVQTCRQGDLDGWLAGSESSHHLEVGHFVRWARANKLTNLEFPAVKWAGPSSVMDTDARWAQARRLLHDNTIKLPDRVAGLLVLLYAQWPTDISRLTVDHVEISDSQVRLRLGSTPIELPEPLATLTRELSVNRDGHATIGVGHNPPWLFPGGRPGRPLSASRLRERLHSIGVHPGQARSTALFALATELPAALLARMLGIHIDVAVAWQRASSGDWASYAADVSRRTDTDK